MASETVTVRYKDNKGFGVLLDGLSFIHTGLGDSESRYSVDDRGDGVAVVSVFGSPDSVTGFTDWLNSAF